jgi:hypothetical protein
METCTLILIIFILILILTENKDIESFKPNDEVFYNCAGKYTKGETNYLSSLNYQEKPSEGFFSHLLKMTDERKDKDYFKSTLCKEKKEFNDKYMTDNKIIDFENNIEDSLIDPFYKYSHPKDNYSILYTEEIQDDMVHQKEKEINLIIR